MDCVPIPAPLFTLVAILFQLSGPLLPNQENEGKNGLYLIRIVRGRRDACKAFRTVTGT